MRLATVLLLSLSASAATPPAPSADGTAADLAGIQGKWVQVAEHYQGKRDKVKNPQTLIISAGEVKTYDHQGNNGSADAPAVYRYALDPSQGPKHLDGYGSGKKSEKKVYKCIYEFDGDRLLISYNGNGSGAGRPTGFEATVRNGYVIMEFERER